MSKLQANSSAISKIYLLFAVLVLTSTINTQAQFIDLRLDIETEVTAKTEQPLDFGTITVNSGRREIDFGSVNMGIFSLTALENQLLLIRLDKPIELTHDNPAIDDVVPVQLSTRYGFSSSNINNSFPLPENGGSIKVDTNPDPGPWNTIYLFIYGFIDIGNIPEGIYDNEIVLDIEYI